MKGKLRHVNIFPTEISEGKRVTEGRKEGVKQSVNKHVYTEAFSKLIKKC